MISENERLDTLLRALLRESPEYSNMEIPRSITDKRNLLRALMNVRRFHRGYDYSHEKTGIYFKRLRASADDIIA